MRMARRTVPKGPQTQDACVEGHHHSPEKRQTSASRWGWLWGSVSSHCSKFRGAVVSSVTGSLDSVSFIHCQYVAGSEHWESCSPGAKASAKHISPINQHLVGGKSQPAPRKQQCHLKWATEDSFKFTGGKADGKDKYFPLQRYECAKQPIGWWRLQPYYYKPGRTALHPLQHQGFKRQRNRAKATGKTHAPQYEGLQTGATTPLSRPHKQTEPPTGKYNPAVQFKIDFTRARVWPTQQTWWGFAAVSTHFENLPSFIRIFFQLMKKAMQNEKQKHCKLGMHHYWEKQGLSILYAISQV